MIAGTDISLTLAGTQILRDVSLTLAPGEVLALCGPNGAGKSTLLSCLAGEHKACAPAIRYFDQPLSALSPKAQAQARVVLEQSPTLTAAFTISELIELGVPLDLPPEALERLKAEALADFGFEARADHFVSALSGGQRHRAHMARVLVQLRANRLLGHECFLFLDEPTASLDVRHQIAILTMVRRLAAEGIGVLVVLHDLNLAAGFADRVLLLKQGAVAYAGPPQEVLTAETLTEVYETPLFVEQAGNGQVMIQPHIVAVT